MKRGRQLNSERERINRIKKARKIEKKEKREKLSSDSKWMK
jgi:hypothetical protein